MLKKKYLSKWFLFISNLQFYRTSTEKNHINYFNFQVMVKDAFEIFMKFFLVNMDLLQTFNTPHIYSTNPNRTVNSI